MKIQEIPLDEQHYKIVLDHLSKSNDKLNVLEVGAGRCILRKSLPKNLKYSSLDMGGDHDYLFDLNKGNLPLKDKMFDIVICLETLEHVLYPHKVMKELLRVAKDDGQLILSLPNEYNLWQRLLFLRGVKTKTNMPFRMVEDNLHIHTPRVKDIIEFFSEYMNINEKKFLWQSRNKNHHAAIYLADKLINILASIYPSLFSRVVIVFAKKKHL